jgi:hypothetical protein
LIEELFRKPVRIETEEDVKFIEYAARLTALREHERGQNLVYSPSGLASCLRRVYLGRHWQELGLQRVELPNVGAHGIFLNGDFLHLKWHFILYKLAMSNADFRLLEIEYPVMSKRKDHGGTLDALVMVEDKIYVVDYKGLNVRNFQNAINSLPHDYRIQITDYMMLLSSDMLSQGLVIESGIMLLENKGGSDRERPLGIYEIEVKRKDGLPEVRLRLEALRQHEVQKEIPRPECVSTKQIQFLECPFADFCKKEVKEIERRNRELESQHAEKLRVARPARTNRSRRSRPK